MSLTVAELREFLADKPSHWEVTTSADPTGGIEFVGCAQRVSAGCVEWLGQFDCSSRSNMVILVTEDDWEAECDDTSEVATS